MEELYPFDIRTMGSRDTLDVTYASEIAIMVEAKDQGDGSLQSLLTLEHFQEMIELESFLLNLTAPAELAARVTPGSPLSFYDLCRKTNVTDEAVE